MSLTQADQTKYKALFLQAAGEYIAELQRNLIEFKQGKETSEIIDTLHRAAHSIKGQSLMMGYTSLGALSLRIEKIFEAKKNKRLVLTKDLVDILMIAADEMAHCMDSIEKTNKENDLSPVIESLNSYIVISV